MQGYKPEINLSPDCELFSFYQIHFDRPFESSHISAFRWKSWVQSAHLGKCVKQRGKMGAKKCHGSQTWQHVHATSGILSILGRFRTNPLTMLGVLLSSQVSTDAVFSKRNGRKHLRRRTVGIWIFKFAWLCVISIKSQTHWKLFHCR